MKIFYLTAFIISIFYFPACQKQVSQIKLSSTDSLKVVNEISQFRTERDSFFQYSSDSPFKKDSTVHFSKLKYFDADLSFYFQSKLQRYDNPETVIVLGTKGEERKQLKYGYFILNYHGNAYKMNVYKFTHYDKKRYGLYKDNLSFWFRDKTTGKETYNVGRYVEIGDENPDPEHIYTIDLNRAYNPYCAYNSAYSCAVPRDEDYLDFDVYAGEKKYHD